MDLLSDVRKGAQHFLSDSEIRKHTEDFWIKLQKAGMTLPASDILAKTMQDLADATDPQKVDFLQLNVEESLMIVKMLGGLACLLQLALVKEQM